MLATNKLSRTVFMIYMNISLSTWYSMKQSFIKTSIFGAEFVTMNVGIETLHAIQYKLRMMGSPISGASYFYGNKMPVIHDTTKPESTLKKKCNAITFHAICKSVAIGKTLPRHMRSEDNPADLLPKVVTWHECKHLVLLVLYDGYYDDT